MEKVFNMNSPREAYQADAAVVWCYDHRFHTAFSKFLKRLGIVNSDIIKVAGGAKSLASPAEEGEREFILRQIQTSIRLHQTSLVIIMLHSDCGAYGGLGRGFGGDAKREMRAQEAELRKAAEYLLENIPGIQVQAYFQDFEGVWQVDLVRNCV